MPDGVDDDAHVLDACDPPAPHSSACLVNGDFSNLDDVGSRMHTASDAPVAAAGGRGPLPAEAISGMADGGRDKTGLP